MDCNFPYSQVSLLGAAPDKGRLEYNTILEFKKKQNKKHMQNPQNED